MQHELKPSCHRMTGQRDCRHRTLLKVQPGQAAGPGGLAYYPDLVMLAAAVS
jgi:hypothetical protein